MKIRCQGDVVIEENIIPLNAEEIVGEFILAHGEGTGHAHRLIDDHSEENLRSLKPLDRPTKKFTVFRDPEFKNVLYLRVFKDTEIIHEEHDSFKIPPGDYRIKRVLEKGMFDDMINPVVD